MGKIVKITGILEIDDRDYDSGPMGPVTESFDLLLRTGERSGDQTGMCPNICDMQDIEIEEVED